MLQQLLLVLAVVHYICNLKKIIIQILQQSYDNMGSNVITHPPVLSPVQSPPKGVTIPYRPKPSGSPVIFAGGQVHITLQRDTDSPFHS